MVFPTITFTLFFGLVFFWMKNTASIIPRAHSFIFWGLVFYGWMNPWISLYLLAYAVVTAYAGVNSQKPYVATIHIVGSLLLLTLAKYLNWGLSWLEIAPWWPSWAVPAALSFITFQGVWAVAQSRRGEVGDISISDRLAHVCFFPSLSSGPITSLSHWMANKELSSIPIHEGIYRIGLGLFQKLVLSGIANQITTVTFADPTLMNTSALWLGAFAYTIEIYADFAGYSNMAIGVALLLGVRLPENFQYPYIAQNIQDFWRRWHMSLSTFFRDNLYIHLLGGNRVSPTRRWVNALMVMLICGLWHGANSTFVVWGLLHGVALVIVYKWSASVKLPKVFSMVLTWLFIVYTWIWFRADSFEQAIQYQQGLLGSDGFTQMAFEWWIFIGLALFIIFTESRWSPKLLSILQRYSWVGLSVFSCVGMAIILLLSPRGLPNFIYYQF